MSDYKQRVIEILSNVSELNYEESSNFINMLISDFDVEEDELINIVSGLNDIVNSQSVSVKEIVETVQALGKSVKKYGLSLEDTIKRAVSIIETTEESGEIIANSIKTFLSRMDKTTAVLSKYVEEGQSTAEMLNSLSEKWDTFTKEQKQEVGIEVAGKYQLSRFVAMMENQDCLEKKDEETNNE